MREFLDKPLKNSIISNAVFNIVTKLGWKYQKPHPKMTAVYVAYPHTPNWDTVFLN